MTYYDEKLRVLQERVQRKAYLIPRLEELKKQKKELEPKLKILEIHAHNESVDVENLEKNTLTSAFYNMFGKKDEKLEKERAEANDWILKRDNAKRELDDINYEISSSESELSNLVNCETEYAVALDEKLDFIKKSGKKDVDYQLILEEKISYCDNQLKEINKAMVIVENSKQMTNEVLRDLFEAESWESIFMRGMADNVKKQDHLNRAKTMVRNLKMELSALKSQMLDVSVDISGLDEEILSKESIKNILEQLKVVMVNLMNLKDKVFFERVKFQIEYEGLDR